MMTLQEIFATYDYTNVLNDIKGEKSELFIDFFYDEDDRKPNELLGIYISKKRDELFVVLNGEDCDVKKLCERWDCNIRTFINFGSDNKAVLKQLKYNVIQLVLFQKQIVDRSEESSLNISRKIFLSCMIDKEGEIFLEEGENIKLPFYMIESDEVEINHDVVTELQSCIPTADSQLDFLMEKKKKANKNNKSFLSVEYGLVKEWLTKDENSAD